MINVCKELFYNLNLPMPPYFGKGYPNFGVIFIVYIFVFEAGSNKYWPCVYAFIFFLIIFKYDQIIGTLREKK